MTSESTPIELERPASPRSEGVAAQTLQLITRQGLVLGLALVANIIAARALAPEGRGTLAFALQASFVLSFIILMGSEKALPVVTPGTPVRSSVPALWALSSRRALAVVAVGAAVSALAIVNPNGSPLVNYGLPVAVMAVGSALNRALEASAVNGRAAQLTVYDATFTGVLTLLAVSALALAGIDHPAIWLAGYAGAAVLVGLTINRRSGSLGPAEIRSARHRPDIETLRKTGFRLFPASLASFAALRSDRLLLPVLDGTESLGLYVVVATLTDVVATPVEAAANILLPRWRKRFLSGGLEVRGEFTLMGCYLAIAGVVSVVGGGLILVPLFGDAYEPAKDLLPILALGSAMFALGRMVAAWRLAQGHINLAATADLIGMVAAVSAYVTLIPLYGPKGAALGSIIGYGSSLAILLIGASFSQPSETLPTDADHLAND